MMQADSDVVVLGLPYDAKSSFQRGAAAGPAAIRQALASPSTNMAAENGLDLSVEARFQVREDLALGSSAFHDIESAIEGLASRGARVVSLGGDHSVTMPILRSLARVHGPLNVLHLDAHADLYDSFEGDRESHACVMARVMEEGLAARLTQVGIRTLNPHQRDQADRYGVEILDMRSWPWTSDGLSERFSSGPFYLSLDLDVLDPAYAPGVSHPEPGGLSVRDLIGIVQGIEARWVGADVVELNPSLDPAGLTARVAAKLLKEIAARMLSL